MGMNRSTLKHRSPKHTDYEKEYRRNSQLVLERAGFRCEIQAAHDCDGYSTGYPHHRKLRSQGGSNSVDNLISVCFTGHNWIHRILPRAEAERLQLIIPRDAEESPYLGVLP